jgi:hypothetical protein
MPLIHSSLFVEMGSCSGDHLSLQQIFFHFSEFEVIFMLYQLAMAIE